MEDQIEGFSGKRREIGHIALHRADGKPLPLSHLAITRQLRG